MIDVLKRLAELDDQNPNIVKESIDGAELAECGGPMSTMVNPSQPQMPASINVTAGSGQEVSDMLSAIMKLAGIEKVEPHHLGAEPEVATLTAEPVSAVGPSATAGDEMRSVMDKLNGADGEEDGEELSSDDESMMKKQTKVSMIIVLLMQNLLSRLILMSLLIKKIHKAQAKVAEQFNQMLQHSKD